MYVGAPNIKRGTEFVWTKEREDTNTNMMLKRNYKKSKLKLIKKLLPIRAEVLKFSYQLFSLCLHRDELPFTTCSHFLELGKAKSDHLFLRISEKPI